MTTNLPESALIVEDDASLRALLECELRELGLRVAAVASGEEALAAIAHQRPTLVLSDLRLPGMDGISLVEHIREAAQDTAPPVVLISAFGTVDRAVDALKRGAADFLTKPVDLEHLRLRLLQILEVERLKQQIAQFRQGAAPSHFHGLIGDSLPMRGLVQEVLQVAQGRSPVLIVGESGVGKEVVARALHRAGPRQDGPFVPVNCASVPESLLESEFFGHTAGAFTGAARDRQGLFAQADGGTLLLDEIGELPMPLQAKLLRVLQEGSVRKIGSESETVLNVRVLAATNQDLEEAIVAGRFRKDLFFRLATFILEVPSLAARRGDVEKLTAHFLTTSASQAKKRIDSVSPSVLSLLDRYPFPGNVRELENIIEHAVTFCSGSVIQVEHLPKRVRDHGSSSGKAETPMLPWLQGQETLLTLGELSTRYAEHVLELTGGNKRRAAKLLGVSRQTLYRYLGREAL